MALDLTRNIPDPDGFYEHLVSSQRHMSDEEANCMNARLVLILSNQIGDLDTLKSAIDFAADPKAGAKKAA
jgi:hypothetical protein